MDLSSIILKIQEKKKYIIIIVVAILVLEAAWAIFSLRSDTQAEPDSTSVIIEKKSQASLSLTAPKKSIRVDETIEVTVNELSGTRTDGTDIVVLYDPKLLSVVLTTQKLPVNVGTLYSDYPLNDLNEKNGQISVSGITSKVGGVVPKGIFGTIVFKAKAAGIAKLSFDFKPGSTTDSNVIETKVSDDILNKVDNLELEIAQ